jgi:hypothetical protein
MPASMQSIKNVNIPKNHFIIFVYNFSLGHFYDSALCRNGSAFITLSLLLARR